MSLPVKGDEDDDVPQFSDHDDDFDEAGEDLDIDETASAAPKAADPYATKLFVGSLSLGTNDVTLRKQFERFGDLVECKVSLEPMTRASRGFAFVIYKHAVDAQKAVRELNGTEMDGRMIKVEFARDRRPHWAAQREADMRTRWSSEPLPAPDYKEQPFGAANKMAFRELCLMLDKIRGAKKQEKLNILFNAKLMQYLKGQSWYPIMRLILPDYDRERPRYNLKEQAIAKLVVRAMGLTLKSNHEDVIRLLKWKDPSVAGQYGARGGGGAVGDFAGVLREVLESRGYNKAVTARKTVGEINALLDKLHNSVSDDERMDVMSTLLKSCDAAEMFWITRIILKDMNCGIKADSVLKRYHQDAQDAITATGDLRRVLAELNDPNIRRAYTVELFKPFSPMLARMVRIDVATERLGDFVIEPKMDGDRMLIHIDRTQNKVMLFTRNMNDYTARYGSEELFGYLLNAFSCEKCIVDGEMLSWDDNDKRVIEFGQTTSVANEVIANGGSAAKKRWLYFVCFDLLFVQTNGEAKVVTGEPLSSRRSRLQFIIQPVERRVEVVQSLVVRETDLDKRHEIVMQELDKMIETKGEGLILKSLASPYVPGEQGRKAGAWVKVKPEHVSGLQEELDCLILGGYYAEGRRRASDNALDASVFLVGVPGGSGPQKEFFCLAKVGTGFSFDELKNLRERLRPFMIKTSSGVKPTHFAMPQRKLDIPDVWIPPEKSVVVQITGSELVPCDWFSANYTLRFPRMSRIRYDKSWTDCTPFSEVERFAKDFAQGKGLHGARRAAEVSRFEAVKYKNGAFGDLDPLMTRRKRARQEQVLRVGDTKHLRDIEVEVEAPLEGHTFFVFPCRDGYGPVRNHSEIQTQEDVEAYIKRKGGKVLKAATTRSEYLCIASDKALQRPSKQIENIIRARSHDLFKVDFIVAVCEEGRSIEEPEYSDYLFMSASTRSTMPDLDEYGDHYYQKSDRVSLEQCMKEVSQKIRPGEKPDLTVAYRALAEDEDDPLAIPRNVCRGMFAFVPNTQDSVDVNFTTAMIRLQGGVCLSSLEDSRLTHVVVTPESDLSAEAIIQEWRSLPVRSKSLAIIRSDLVMALKREESPITWDLYPNYRNYLMAVA